MSKYIDAECLKAKLDEHYRKYQSKYMETRLPYTQGLLDALDLAEQAINSLQQEQPELYFYCKYGGTMPLCSDCKRNHNNSPFKTEEIATWYAPSNGTKHCIDYIQQEQSELPEKYQAPDWIWKDKTIDQLAEEYVEGVKKCNNVPTWDLIHTAVCYGYELGLNARKEE